MLGVTESCICNLSAVCPRCCHCCSHDNMTKIKLKLDTIRPISRWINCSIWATLSTLCLPLARVYWILLATGHLRVGTKAISYRIIRYITKISLSLIRWQKYINNIHNLTQSTNMVQLDDKHTHHPQVHVQFFLVSVVHFTNRIQNTIRQIQDAMITLKFTNLPLLFLLIANQILCYVGGRYLLILTFFTCFESIQSDCPLYHWTIINLTWPWWSYCLTKTYSSSKHILKKVGNLYEETIFFVLYFIQKAIAILSWAFEYLNLSLLLQ